MGIGTSDGQYYDNETDYVFDQFSKGQQSNFETKLSKEEESKYQDWKSTYAPNDSGFDYDLRGAFKAGVTPDNESNHWPDTFKKPNHPTFSDQSQYAKDAPHLAGSWNGDTYIPPANIDDLIAAAPSFTNSSVIDQMSATAKRSRPEPTPEPAVSAGPKAPGSASAAQEGSDSYSLAARPVDPSVDSFIDRYGVWNIHDQLKKDEEDARIADEVSRTGKIKAIKPGTKAWPNTSNVISDATPDKIKPGQKFAANIHGKGSDLDGPYMTHEVFADGIRKLGEVYFDKEDEYGKNFIKNLPEDLEVVPYHLHDTIMIRVKKPALTS